MSSLNAGKKETVEWVHRNYEKGATCLDVGACDGKWHQLLGDYLDMDAVEVYAPNITKWWLTQKYSTVYYADIREFSYEHYDLIIFGDVIEHMSIDEARKVLTYAYPRCKDMVVAVPFMWHQDAIYGNPYEKHIQEDLTHEVFMKRYEGFKPLAVFSNYGYYVKEKENFS